MESLKLLFDSNRGVYIPQHFAEEIKHHLFSNVSDEQIEILKKGPDEELYWDVWHEILDNAEHIDEHGFVWRLYQDGDVWLYCEELMEEEEKRNFFDEWED